MESIEETTKKGLVARFPVSPEQVTILWNEAAPLAPYAGHRVRLLEHVISLSTLINVSAETLLRQVKALAEGAKF